MAKQDPRQVTITFAGDTDQLDIQIAHIKSAVNKLGLEVAQAFTSINTNTKQATTSFTTLAKSTAEAEKAVKSLQNAQKSSGITNVTAGMGNELDRLKAKVAAFRQENQQQIAGGLKSAAVEQAQREGNRIKAIKAQLAKDEYQLTQQRNAQILQLEHSLYTKQLSLAQGKEKLTAIHAQYNAQVSAARDATQRILQAEKQANAGAAGGSGSGGKGFAKGLLDLSKQIFEVNVLWSAINNLNSAFAKAVTSIIPVGIALDSVKASLESTVGTGISTTIVLNALAKEADRVGINVGILRKNFATFQASTSLAGVSLKDTWKMFQNINSVSTALHKTQDETNNIFLALSQIFNKSKVQSEELVRQLGNLLPGAFAAFAASIRNANGTVGISTSQLVDRMKAGTVLAKNTMLDFTDFMASRFSASFAVAAGMLNADIGRMQTSLTLLGESIYKLSSSTIQEFVRGFTKGVDAVRNWITVERGLDSVLNATKNVMLAVGGIGVSFLFAHIIKLVAIIGTAITSVGSLKAGLIALGSSTVVGAIATATLALGDMVHGVNDEIRGTLDLIGNLEKEKQKLANNDLNKSPEERLQLSVEADETVIAIRKQREALDAEMGKLTNKSFELKDAFYQIPDSMRATLVGLKTEIEKTLDIKLNIDPKSKDEIIQLYSDLGRYLAQTEINAKEAAALTWKDNEAKRQGTVAQEAEMSAAEQASNQRKTLEAQVQTLEEKIAQKQIELGNVVGQTQEKEREKLREEVGVLVKQKLELSEKVTALGADNRALEKELATLRGKAADITFRAAEANLPPGQVLPGDKADFVALESRIKALSDRRYNEMQSQTEHAKTERMRAEADLEADRRRYEKKARAAEYRDTTLEAGTKIEEQDAKIKALSESFAAGELKAAEYVEKYRQLKDEVIQFKQEALVANAELAASAGDAVNTDKFSKQIGALQSERDKLTTETKKLTRQLEEEYNQAALKFRGEAAGFTGQKGESQADKFDRENRKDYLRIKREGNVIDLQNYQIVKANRALQGELTELEQERGRQLGVITDRMTELNTLQNAGAVTELEVLLQTKALQEEKAQILQRQLELIQAAIAEQQQALPPGGKLSAELVNQQEEIRRQLLLTQRTSDTVGQYIERTFTSAFGNSFALFISGSQSASEAFKSFANSILADILRIATQQIAKTIFSTISSGIGGAGGISSAIGAAITGSEKGNAFSSSITEYSKGGIPAVDSNLAYFPMAKGGIGSLRERGPEAILPLSRTSSGELGVKSSGGQGSGNVVNIGINVTQSPGEDGEQFANRVAEKLVRRLADEQIQNASRPNGLLNKSTRFG
jgi:tape measure domain-containing protein